MDGLSIGILSHNGYKVLEECIECIISQELPKVCEIFVVDNNSPSEVEEDTAMRYGFRLIKADNKYHFITGLNTVFREAKYRTVLFVSNDVFFRPGAIMNLYNASKFHDIIQPVFYGMDGKIQNAGMNYIWPGYGIGRKKKTDIVNSYKDMVTTTAIMIDKSAFIKIGEFDTQFDPAFCEDNDYSIRAWELRINTYIVPTSEADHGTSHTFSRMKMDKTISQICHENRLKVIKKHFKGLDKWSRLIAMNLIDHTYYLLRDFLRVLHRVYQEVGGSK